MKAKLIFELPEDQEEFNVTTKGIELYLTCLDLDTKMRDYLKYGHKFESADDAIEDLRQCLQEILESRNCNLEMMS